MNINDLDRISPSLAVNLAVFFLSFLGPGFLFWYVYDHALFERLEFLKLMVLALAVSAPTFLVPFILSALFKRVLDVRSFEGVGHYGNVVDWYLRHGVGNALNMYTIIIFVFWFDMSSRAIVFLVLGTIALNVIAELLVFIKLIRSPENSNAIWFPRLDRNSAEHD